MLQVRESTMNIRHRPQDPLLHLRNIRVMRGEKIVLYDFSLRVNVDEHIAVLGPNGCGKSTLIKTITRECYPMARDGSSMSILGQKNWNVFELRSLLGIVSNDLMSSCTGDASGLDVVLSGFFSSTRIFPNHAVDPKHRDLAEKSLAILAQHGLRETMRKLANSGIGIILVTHELPDVVPEIERVVLMSNGRIVADGRKEDVLKAEQLGQLFGLTVELGRRDGYYHIW